MCTLPRVTAGSGKHCGGRLRDNHLQHCRHLSIPLRVSREHGHEGNRHRAVEVVASPVPSLRGMGGQPRAGLMARIRLHVSPRAISGPKQAGLTPTCRSSRLVLNVTKGRCSYQNHSEGVRVKGRPHQKKSGSMMQLSRKGIILGRLEGRRSLRD
jgi:hypothetical protein